MPQTINLPQTHLETLQDHLTFLYGPQVGTEVMARLKAILLTFHQENQTLYTEKLANPFTEADAILITYGDQVQATGRPALQVLADTLQRYLQGVINTVHILPFYPYSSDDGFSVIDYLAIDPNLGQWSDLAELKQNFRLMIDAVVNHISAQSAWFKGFLAGDEKYADYFITTDPQIDLSSITRPRTHPLLTPFETANGRQYVWTTFSADQVDLNLKNPDVLLELTNILLFYIAQGADLIRLDAIGYLWKEIGTTSLHLPQTHRVIQLWRAILDSVAPNVALITETNVPHAENIAYFGDGQNEAQMVYQFSLAPLILHAFHTGNAEPLQHWAATLETPSPQTTFFNFIASHDGLGVMPAKGILGDDDIQRLVDKTLAHGGQVSYKTNPDGSQSVYELNITLFDALSDPHSDEPKTRQIDRFMASQAIMLALAGVPGIYIHSLFGSANNLAGLAATGRARTINRQKWLQTDLAARLDDPASSASQVFRRYTHLLNIRTGQAAFHPNAAQDMVNLNPTVVSFIRTASTGQRILCLHNVSAQEQTLAVDQSKHPALSIAGPVEDLLSGQLFSLEDQALVLTLAPYQVLWLRI